VNPFSDSYTETIGSLGEIELIQRIKSWLGEATPTSPRGVGDDCAVLPLPKDKESLLITTDPIVYGRHFDDSLTPEAASSKLIRRNLSDIAAMGGTPASAVLSLSAPATLSLPWLERFYRQIAIEAKTYAIEISGGDICSTDSHLGIYVTLFGYAGPRTLQRKRAKTGDRIFVTGSLGGTRLRKHYDFEPRLREGQWLASRADISSCMDISDGLGKDLPLLLPEALAAHLDAKSIPISEDAIETAQSSGKEALYHAFNDGEDFELLFTVSKEANCELIIAQWKSAFETQVTEIGLTSELEDASDERVVIEHAPKKIELKGYEHYRRT